VILRQLRYTKIALLIFGLGMIAGLVVVAGEYPAWERAASAAMALGLVLIPVGLFADGRGMALIRWLTARFSRRKTAPGRSRQRIPVSRRKQPIRATARAATRKRGPKRRR